MTVNAVTRPWFTSAITVMSNVTSVQVRGNKVTKLETSPGPEPKSPGSIFIDLDVEQKGALPSVLASTEELGLILSPQDALELGLLLVAMGLENKTSDQVSTTLDRLTHLIAEVK